MSRVALTSLLLIVITLFACSSAEDFSSSDVQMQQLFQQLQGKRIAMLTNPSCIDTNYDLVFDVVFSNQTAFNYTLKYALSPEHGLRGDQDAGATIVDYIDPVTGIPVYSLYGTRRAPTPAMLSEVDAIVFCILDVGTRFYTFHWTMSYAQEAIGNYNENLTVSNHLTNNLRKSQKPSTVGFIVIDRPNVLGGVKLEGCPLEVEGGYIGRLFNQTFTIPTRYAMTTGELALLFNDQYLANKVKDLSIIVVPDYFREDGFLNATMWVPPSPNMINFQTAFVYPGTGIFEQTNISEGRGTVAPFQIIGAPFINGTEVSETLRSKFNKTASFEPITFVPTTSKFVNQTCHGVKITVKDSDSYDSVLVGTTLLQILLRKYPSNITLSQSGSNRVFGTKDFFDQIKSNSTVEQILHGCRNTNIQFERIRRNYLIYPYAVGEFAQSE